jgi:hypothetical protein
VAEKVGMAASKKTPEDEDQTRPIREEIAILDSYKKSKLQMGRR